MDSDRVDSRLESAHAALARGAWDEARRAFTEALAEREDPGTLEGLGLAAWWLDDATAVFEARESAYRLYHDRHDRRGAGRVAMSLAEDALYFRGQPALARGWLGRAQELLAGLDAIPEQGWLCVVEGDIALMIDGDMAKARECARRAAAAADQLALPDLAIVARGLEGVALAGSGNAAEAMTHLDQVATAALHGEVKDPLAIGICCCYLMIACEQTRDLDRAAQWSDEIRRFCERWRMNSVLALCRAQYAGLLVERGLWAEAERELEAATVQLTVTRPALRAEGLVRLAALRRRQGRFEEAARLLEENAWHPLAMFEGPALAFDRGRAEEAARGTELFLRHAREVPGQIAGLDLLVAARLAAGDMAGAAEALGRLEAVAGAAATGALRSAVCAGRARLALALGDAREAARGFDEAIHELTRAGAVFDAARLRLELAEADLAAGNADGAARHARAAEKALRALGAQAHADRAAEFVRDLEAPAAPAKPGGLTAREVSVLRLVAQGSSNQEIAGALFVSEFTVKRHVANILNKLDLPSRAAAAAYAARNGLA